MSELPQILILPGWYPNEFHPYSGDFVKYQARLLYQNKLPVSVLNLDLNFRRFSSSPLKWAPKYSQSTDCQEVPHFEIKGAFAPRINSYLLKAWASNFLKLFERFNFHKQNPVLIHAHNYLGGLGAYLIHEKYQVPYILTEHSTSFLDDSVPVHHQQLIKKAFEKASVILAVSSSLKENLKPWTDTRIEVLPNFIDTALFTPGLQNDANFTFIFAGDLIPRKNVTLLIDAFAEFTKVHPHKAYLKICGSGPLKKSLKFQVKKHGLTSRIQFAGQRSQSELANDFQNAHVLVLPSIYESFGLVLVEAMACGLVVISTPCGGPLDIISASTGKLVSDFTLGSLSLAMLNIFENYSNYNSISVRKEVLQKFSAQAIIPQLTRLYKSYS